MRIFVPVEDVRVDHEADLLVPYRCGVACAHALRNPAPCKPATDRNVAVAGAQQARFVRDQPSSRCDM